MASPQLAQAQSSKVDCGNDSCLHVLVTGRIKAGKSALVNSLRGKVVARESAVTLFSETVKVSTFTWTVPQGVSVVFYDTPGLDEKDLNAVEEIKKHWRKINLVLYCHRMDANRVRLIAEDEEALTTLTREFGKDLWEKAVLVLTFANEVEAGTAMAIQRRWVKILYEKIEATAVPRELAQRIPVESAGFHKDTLQPWFKDWTRNIWEACAKAQPSLKPLVQKLAGSHSIPAQEATGHFFPPVFMRWLRGSYTMYRAQVYYIKQMVNTWTVNFVIIPDLEEYSRFVKRTFLNAVAGSEFHVTFEGEEIALNLPDTGVVVDSWTITPLTHPVITKSTVDYCRPGRQPPCCQLKIECTGMGKPKHLLYKVELKGAKEPQNHFFIVLEGEFTSEATVPSLGPDSLNDVCQELWDIWAKWYNIGLQLGLRLNFLETIRYQNQDDAQTCLLEMSFHWLKKVDPPPTWEGLACALESRTVGEPRLAEKLRTKYCKTEGATGPLSQLSFDDSEPYQPQQSGGELRRRRQRDESNLDSTPSLVELLSFAASQGRTINIPEEIGTKYKMFGVLLLKDQTGAMVDGIVHKHHRDSVQINCEILHKWVHGEAGEQPVSWRTLITCLRDSGMSTLASDIQQALL